MGEQRPGDEGRGRRLFGLILLLVILLGIGAFVLFFLGKSPGGGILPLPPVEVPTSAVQPGQGGTQAVTLPNAPTITGADVVAVYDVPVSWQDNSDNEDGFNVYRQRTDVAGQQVKAGSVGMNTTTFLDKDTYCGETYHYTVASFNAAGESPATVCWEITLPPCPKDQALDLQPGQSQGYNFLTGGISPNSDFYLPPVGQPRMFMADQPGQGGLIDLGDTGDVPLHHVTLPDPPTYQRGGVAAVAGHTYAALATDQQSVIVFKVTKLGDDAVFNYIVWRPEKFITGACSQTTVGTPTTTVTCQCDQRNTLICSNGTRYQNDKRCTGQPNCECTLINLGSQQVGVMVCKYPNGTTKASLDPVCQPPRDCGCEVNPSTNQITGNWVCKNSVGAVVSSVPAPTLCPKRICSCDKDGQGNNTGDVTCKSSDGTIQKFPGVDSLLCPKPGETCGDGIIQGSEECEKGIACPKAGDVCNVSTCACVPPSCACDNAGNYICKDVTGQQISTTPNAPQCQRSCACDTAGNYVCKDATGQVSTTPNAPQCQCRCVTDTAGNNTGMQVCGNNAPVSNPNACPPSVTPPPQDCYCTVTNGGWDGTETCVDALGNVTVQAAPPSFNNGCPPPVCAGPGANSTCDPACGPGQTCNADCTCSGGTQPTCGNGIVEAGETCDPPGSACGVGTTAAHICNSKCQCR